MANSRSDLLSVTRLLIRVATVMDLLAICLLAVVLTALFVGDPTKMTIGRIASTLSPADRLFAARVSVAGGLIGLLLALPLLRLLLRIVDSARQADPFVPQNGMRLRRIGALMLAINIVTEMTFQAALQHRIGLPLSFSALLTVLMVFVIARIFETGSQMRAELKETI